MDKLKHLVLIIVLLSVNSKAQDRRNYADYEIEIFQDILLSDYEIYRPNLLDVYKSDSVVFFDFARYKLVVYDIKNREFQFYGSRGKGPKEFGQIFDAKVDGNGELYLTVRQRRFVTQI